MGSEALHPEAITALLQEVRQEVKDGFRTLQAELRSIERAQVADRRALEQHVNAETRRLDGEIAELRSRLDVSKGEAKVAGRLWGSVSSIVTALIVYALTNLL